MNLIRAMVSSVVVGALALTGGACQRTAEGVKKDAAEAAAKAEKAAADAAKAATEAGQAVAAGAKEAALQAADATAAAGEKAAEASQAAGAAVAAAAQTFDVKASLMADPSINAGQINVDTDPKTKTVILKGSVATTQQKAAAEKLALSKASGYKVVNQLVVAPEKK